MSKKEVQKIEPKKVFTQEELRDAMGSISPAFIIEGDSMFNELEPALVKTRGVKKAKDIGKKATIGAFIFAPAVAVAVAAGGTAIAHFSDKFKNYMIYIDYKTHKILLVNNKFKKEPADFGVEAQTIIDNSPGIIK